MHFLSRARFALRLAIVLLAALFLAPAGHAADVRIGVFGLFHPLELEVRSAPGGILLLHAGEQSITLEGVDVAHLRLAGKQIKCSIADRAITASSLTFTARDGGIADLWLAVPGKIHRRFRGRLSVTALRGFLQPVMTMDLELAVASSVAAESDPTAPLEALKAQAVVTRSYYAAGAQHRDYDFCDTTHCQFLRQPPPSNSPAWLATRQTAGLVLAYQGVPIAAMYTAACGGRTRSLAQIGVKAHSYPYFSVECKYCERNPQPWSADLDRAQAAELLKTPGEAARLAIGRRNGWKKVPGNNYRATIAGDRVLLAGSGSGHGVGLCQRGAGGMAADGATFQEILSHYYPNTAVVSLSR